MTEPQGLRAGIHAFGGLQPRLAPDGQRLALSYQGSIAVLPIAGGTLRCLSRGESWDSEPAWSPDGRKIAYIASPQQQAGPLRIMSAEDGSSADLPREMNARGPLFFHPHEPLILGRFAPRGRPQQMGFLNYQTGQLQLIGASLSNETGPYALSQDGETIWFAVHRDEPGQQDGVNGPSAELWRWPWREGQPETWRRFPARAYRLALSPSGTELCLVTDLGVSHQDLWMISVTDRSRPPWKWTFGQADEDWPSWDASGERLVWTDNRSGATGLMRKDVGQSEPVPIEVDAVSWGIPTGTLRLLIVDAESGAPWTARVSLKRVGGKFHAPLASMHWVNGTEGFYYAQGEANVTLPAGEYTCVARRGFETFIETNTFEVGPGARREVTMALSRWINMPQRGWYSGENHIHANYGYGAWYHTPSSILPMIEGEDLHVANVMVANSDGDGVYDREHFLGMIDPISRDGHLLYWNEEFRSTAWGHMTLIQLEHLVEPLFTGFLDTTHPYDVPTNADIGQQAHWQKASVSYTHPASKADDPYAGAYAAKGLPVDAALGEIDTLDVMGFSYGPTLGVWYRLLNCGFRIPAAAGTDCFLNRLVAMPPGWGRCYVHLAGGLNYKDWVEGQRAGRSFVTAGPMLAFEVEGKESGETLILNTARPLRVKATAWSRQPLDVLELILNGRVVAKGELDADRFSAKLDLEYACKEGGWLAVRTGQQGGPAAHANPVYLEWKDRALDASNEARYFLDWIDRLEADLDRRGRIPEGERARVKEQLTAARAVYRGKIR